MIIGASCKEILNLQNQTRFYFSTDDTSIETRNVSTEHFDFTASASTILDFEYQRPWISSLM